MNFVKLKPIEFLPIVEDSLHLDIGLYFILIKSFENKSNYGKYLLDIFMQSNSARKNMNLFQRMRDIKSYFNELDSINNTRVYIFDYTYYVSKDRWRLALEIIKGIKEIRGIKTISKIPRNEAIDLNKLNSLFKEEDKNNIISAYKFLRESSSDSPT